MEYLPNVEYQKRGVRLLGTRAQTPNQSKKTREGVECPHQGQASFCVVPALIQRLTTFLPHRPTHSLRHSTRMEVDGFGLRERISPHNGLFFALNLHESIKKSPFVSEGERLAHPLVLDRDAKEGISQP